MSFVPDGFEPPLRLAGDGFVLEPLGPQHNDDDYAAWTSSMEHIRATPGFASGNWPREMSHDDNRQDLERHAADFDSRRGFTYTVLDAGDGRVIGCVYIYPRRDGPAGAHVSSWVTADRAELDGPLRAAVRAWLRESWPFDSVDYAG
jgi:RimJ/RimL family protein N-acetyltransferase